MSLIIRLTRTGKRNSPSYRVVVAEKRSKRDGRFVENLGFYNPAGNPVKYKINRQRFEHWKSLGAQTSQSVQKLMSNL